jgi:hypothetical protein
MNDLTQSRWLPIVLLTGSNIFYGVRDKSARGLAHSTTLRAARSSLENAAASWTAVALRRFSTAQRAGAFFDCALIPTVSPWAIFGHRSAASNPLGRRGPFCLIGRAE